MPTAPIQVIPKGLLGFLELKNGGQYPSQLGDVLTPTFNAIDWYFRTNAEAFITGFVALGVGLTVITTSIDEWQFFTDFSVETETLGAGEAVECCGAFAVDVTPKVFQLTDYTGALAPGQAGLMSNVVGFFLPPNSSLGVWTKSLTGAVTARLMFRRVILKD